MISKELLGEVLGFEIDGNIYEQNNEIKYRDLNNSIPFYQSYSISIYELAHKCKEYIRKLGYQIKITYVEYNGNIFIELVDWRSGEAKIMDGCFKADNEFDATIEAAQWVMENSNEQ